MMAQSTLVLLYFLLAPLGVAGKGVVTLNFKRSTQGINNLGCKGPDINATQCILEFKNIGTTTNNGKPSNVDLIVANVSEFEPANASKTGLKEAFGQINVMGHSHHSLEFSLVYSDGSGPVLGKSFYLTFFDIDSDFREGGAKERLAIKGFDSYYILANSELQVWDGPDGSVDIQSQEAGSSMDNPRDARDDINELRVVSFLFVNTDKFRINYTVHGGMVGYGRNFMFGNSSKVIEDAEPICAGGETAERLRLEKWLNVDFFNAKLTSSNLGGLGPNLDDPEMLRFSDVGFLTCDLCEDRYVDLISWTNSSYAPKQPNKNGVSGTFGAVNVGTGGQVKLHFLFVERGTNTPIEQSSFYFSFFDFDQMPGDVSREAIMIKGFSYYFTSPSTQLEVTEAFHGYTQFQSTTAGTKSDNPENPRDLSREQLDRSVAFFFEYTNVFDVIMKVSDGPKSGRNFIFAGASEAVYDLHQTPCGTDLGSASLHMGTEPQAEAVPGPLSQGHRARGLIHASEGTSSDSIVRRSTLNGTGFTQRHENPFRTRNHKKSQEVTATKASFLQRARVVQAK